MNTYVAQAIELAGGASAVATLFNLKTVWAVYKWVSKGIPPDRVIPLAEAIKWQVTPHQMAPSIYPHPDDGLPDLLRGKSPLEVAA